MANPVGITNHAPSVEAAEDAKLKDAPQMKDTQQPAPRNEARHLPTGMGEKVETVEISTSTPKP